MEEKSLKEVMEEYKLSPEKHEKIKNKIIDIYLYDKTPVEKPKAIIDIAPPASGKTGLNSYGKNEFEDENVVIINSDEIKLFHPKIEEIADKYPQYYTKVTDQESNTWTSDVFDEVLKKGYNVIFEGTGRNARILETIKEKMKKYKVTVRGMAVNKGICLISLLDRYWEQIKSRGWGRLVILDHFYETYKNMPETMDIIEKSGIVDSVEVLKRGEVPRKPLQIYNSKNINNRFLNAKSAILEGRGEIEEVKNAYNYFENNKKKIEDKLKNEENISKAELLIIEEILGIFREYKNIIDREEEKDSQIQ